MSAEGRGTEFAGESYVIFGGPALVRDPGEGFDPDTLKSPIVGECLYSESGRGIYLINEFMDEVRFRKGGTEIVMKKG